MLLSDKVILIAGGESIAGDGIVRTLLEYGATVIVPSTAEEKIELLRMNVRQENHLYVINADVKKPEQLVELAGWIKARIGYLDAVIDATGEWWQSRPLLDISMDLWNQFLENSLTTHFMLAKTFLPELINRRDASYLFINGVSGINAVPHPGSYSLSAACEIMLKDIFHAENENYHVRINTLLIDAPVFMDNYTEELFDVLSVEDIGRYCTFLVSSNAKNIKGQTLVIHGQDQIQEINLVEEADYIIV